MKKKPFSSTDPVYSTHTRPSKSNQSSQGRDRALFITSLALLIGLIAVLTWVTLRQLHAGNQSAQSVYSPNLTTIHNTHLSTSPTTPATPILQVEPPRRDSTLAYDPLHHVVLLFGGSIESVEGPPTNETWAWNGHSWKQLHPASSPPALQGKMIYDLASQRIILFLYQIQGGVNVTNEMWSWNGTTWQQLHPETMPEVVGASLAYDEAQHQIVLFGGGVPSVRTVMTMNATWTWDGTT